MIAAGGMHFLNPDFYLKIMPPYLPYPRLLVLASGAAAIGLGVLMFWERLRNTAAKGMIAFFVAVFPANLHMALHPEIFPSIPAWAAWARLPLQGFLIYWAYSCRQAD